MSAPTNYYVDPSIAGNSGSGTSGDPYGDLQYALDSITRDATNGDQLNIIAGTAEYPTTTLSLATYGSPSFSAPLIFRGCTSTANDGGIGKIDGGAGNFTIFTHGGVTGVHFIDLELCNTGTASALSLGNHSTIAGCIIHDVNTHGIFINSYSIVENCHFYGISAYALQLIGVNCSVNNSYFSTSGTYAMTIGVYQSTAGHVISRNVFSLSGRTTGIYCANYGAEVRNNSFLSSSGTGYGIRCVNASGIYKILSNVVEGFSGSGGKGISVEGASAGVQLYGSNAVYNCETAYSITVDDCNVGDNETLSATPFAKSGSDSYSNRFTYFAPVDTGNVIGGSYPSGSNLDKGAVQSAASGGGLLRSGGWSGGYRG